MQVMTVQPTYGSNYSLNYTCIYKNTLSTTGIRKMHKIKETNRFRNIKLSNHVLNNVSGFCAGSLIGIGASTVLAMNVFPNTDTMYILPIGYIIGGILGPIVVGKFEKKF